MNHPGSLGIIVREPSCGYYLSNVAYTNDPVPLAGIPITQALLVRPFFFVVSPLPLFCLPALTTGSLQSDPQTSSIPKVQTSTTRHHSSFLSCQTSAQAMMRVDLPALNDKRGLARHQLNLPIARSPITIQSSSSPVRSTHVQSDVSPTTPSPTLRTSDTNVSSRQYGSLPKGTRSGSAEWQHKHNIDHSTQGEANDKTGCCLLCNVLSS